MARECATCYKKGMVVWRLKKLRGKYNPTVKRRQQPNLQWVRIPIDTKRKLFKKFAGKRLRICAKCRKTLVKRASVR